MVRTSNFWWNDLKTRKRFLDKIKFNPSNGCWEWTANIVGGRGHFKLTHFQTKKSHRLMYEWANGGIISQTLVIDHLCRNPKYCNPFHLEEVTTKENINRGFSPSAVIARTKVCKRGHLLTEDNVNKSSLAFSGMKTCQICFRNRQDERNKRKKEMRALIRALRRLSDVTTK